MRHDVFSEVPERKIVDFEIIVPGLSASWQACRGASGAWVAVCDELNVTVEGDSLPDTKEAADEVMRMILEDA